MTVCPCPWLVSGIWPRGAAPGGLDRERTASWTGAGAGCVCVAVPLRTGRTVGGLVALRMVMALPRLRAEREICERLGRQVHVHKSAVGLWLGAASRTSMLARGRRLAGTALARGRRLAGTALALGWGLTEGRVPRTGRPPPARPPLPAHATGRTHDRIQQLSHRGLRTAKPRSAALRRRIWPDQAGSSPIASSTLPSTVETAADAPAILTVGLHVTAVAWTRLATGEDASFAGLAEVTRCRLCLPLRRADELAVAPRDLRFGLSCRARLVRPRACHDAAGTRCRARASLTARQPGAPSHRLTRGLGSFLSPWPRAGA